MQAYNLYLSWLNTGRKPTPDKAGGGGGGGRRGRNKGKKRGKGEKENKSSSMICETLTKSLGYTNIGA